ncbi:ankyrin repeat domain-containing protein 31 isoform X5 [Gallus gallus]|uniref:ankyrin repeat domain-containing protein 31 isoform X5 n=1 Tax=Gallus gallus TaxID=9031 RepID=UPI001AE4032C|nr:ankyrin repeat domain-containing protein 31 isoform X5 [Gallus gallus]XP_046792474.1 ankyrin repeat domain-containing protein 31 isoform X5 [Gallus gallus]
MSEWCGVDGCNESVVFGFVARSDAEEEEELSSWRLSPINTSMTLTTEIGGVFSPEISCIVPDPSYENQKLSYEDLSPEAILCPDTFLEEIVTPQDIFLHVLEDCQRPTVAVIDTDNSIKEQLSNNDKDLSMSAFGKILMESLSLTEQSLGADELESSDSLRFLSDSGSPTVINPLHVVLEYPDCVFSSDAPSDKNSDALPVELVTELNSVSGSVIQPDIPVVPSKRQLNTKEEQANSEHDIARQVGDDCTQITSMLEPPLPVIQLDKSEPLTGSSLQRTTYEQLVSDHQKGKEVISNYWNATCKKKGTRKGSSHLVEAVLCAETTKTTSGRTMELRETSSIRYTDSVSSHEQMSEGLQKLPHSRTTGSKAKYFSKIQKSSKNKQDPEINMSQELSQNEDRKADQRRRSKRIRDKMRQEVCHKSFTNPQYCVTLSRINKRNACGETLLHRAVAAEDLNYIHNLIKASANVDDKDYGWTALHEASLEGHYQIAKELLKAGADVNARGDEQITPLLNAVKEGHYKVAALLLHYGADPLLKNEMGTSALDEASDPCMKRLLKHHLARSERDSVSGGGDAENTLSAQSTEDTNLHKQGSLGASESELACANLTDSGRADILQQTVENEMQSTYTNILDDRASCMECTLKINTETLLVSELLATTGKVSSSGSPSNSTDDVLNANEQKVPQPETRGGILLSAEESTGKCHTKETKDAHSLEILFRALQLRDKKIHQIKRKRQDIKDTNSKSDKGRFAGVGGTEGTEKNKEGSGKSNVLLQFSEVEVQTKRLRLDPQETRQKTDLCSSVSQNKLSSTRSKFNQASAQQTSKKSVETKTKKKNAKGETELHVAARSGNLSLVKTLISAGIPVNEQDNAGWTAIHEASAGGFTDVISELLKAGADVNSRGLDGILPIHDAVYINSLEAARILLQNGANPCERNDSGKSAVDEACDDEMKELLTSYCSIEYVPPVESSDVTVAKWNCCRSRRQKSICLKCCENGDTSLEPQSEKYGVNTVAAIQDVEKKQKELLLLELRTSEDADVFIQGLSQIESTLNKVFAERNADRDALAKKYRSSAESFKKGARRGEVANLSYRQNNLMTVVQNQKRLLQKIENYRKTKQVFVAPDSEKQIMNPDVVTYAMGLGSSMPTENRIKAHLSSESRFSAQECSQYPNNCLAETEANKEAVRSKVVSDSTSASENWIRKYYFCDMSRLTNALPSKPAASTAKTTCLQQKDIDHIAVGEQGNKSLNPTSVANTLNISEAQSSVASNNVCQPGSDCQQALADEDIHTYVNKKDAFQQHQQVMASASADNFPNLHEMFFQSCGNSFNAESMVANFTSNTDYPVNLSEKPFQNYGYKECEQKQRKHARKNKKKLQLIDLLELGRIKPGENVLEFTLKEFTCKATLLTNGKIKTSKNKIFQNPVQWVKDLLGSDIYVTWKYAWNKVVYRGTQLSKLVVENAPVSNDLEIPSQQRELPETVKTFPCTEREAAESLPVARELKSFSVQFNSVESLTCFLQFTELFITCTEEFLPWPVMEKHWNFYRACEDFGF